MKLIQNSVTKKVHIQRQQKLYESICFYHGWPGSDKVFEGDISQVNCKRCLKAYKEDDNK